MPPRNICEVISTIQAQLPVTESACSARLERLARNTAYTAPELMSSRWMELAMILSEELPDPSLDSTPDWVVRVGRIVRAEE